MASSLASKSESLRALSIRPPWAWAIVYAGKRIENRSWSTNYRGPLLIHASSSLSHSDVRSLERILGRRVDPGLFIKGAIVATGVLADIVPVQKTKSRWAVGPLCWVLRDVQPLAEPIPVSGALQLWDPRKRLKRSQMAALEKVLKRRPQLGKRA